MLNPSLNHQPATRLFVLITFVVAICMTLPLAAMRAPEQAAAKTVSAPGVLVAANAPAAKAPTPVAVKKSAAPKPAAAQGLADGTLSGTVYDGSGAVVPGVTVTVFNAAQSAQMVTGPVGGFEFRALPAGQYSLTAELPGFLTYRRGRLEIKPSQTLQQNITLIVGNVVERVTVTALGQRRPIQSPGTPQRIRVGGNVQAPNLISQVKPIYPQTARAAGIEGVVHLQGIISVDGTLMGLRVLGSNDADLTKAALESVSQWRYRPTLLNGVPVEVLTDIDVEFRLAQ